MGKKGFIFAPAMTDSVVVHVHCQVLIKIKKEYFFSKKLVGIKRVIIFASAFGNKFLRGYKKEYVHRHIELTAKQNKRSGRGSYIKIKNIR